MARLPKVYQRERDLRAHVLLFVLTLASTVPAASAQLFAAGAANDAAFAIRTQFNCPATAADCSVEWTAASRERDILVAPRPSWPSSWVRPSRRSGSATCGVRPASPPAVDHTG